MCWYHVTVHLDLELKHTLDVNSSGTIVCRFGRHPVICLREEAIFVTAQKCTYHVTFDLDLDLEHTLDAGLPGSIVCKFGLDPVICLRKI